MKAYPNSQIIHEFKIKTEKLKHEIFQSYWTDEKYILK
jgi:hypothetical protein